MAQPHQDPTSQTLNRFTKRISSSLLSNLIGKFLNYLAIIILAKILGATQFGLYILGFSIVKLLSLISSSGIGKAVLRYIPIYLREDKNKVNGIILGCTALVLLISVSFSFIIIVFSGFVAETIFKDTNLTTILILFSIGLPMFACYSLANFILVGFKMIKKYIFLSLIFPILNFSFIFVFIYLFRLDVLGGVLAWIVSAAFSLILSIIYIKPHVDFSKKINFEYKRIIRYSTPLTIVGLSMFLILWADTLILGYFRGPLDVGVYRAAVQLPLLMNMFIGSFAVIFSPYFSEFSHKNDIKSLNAYAKISTRWIFLISMLPFSLVMVFPKEIMRFFGPEFMMGWPILIILFSAQLINTATGMVSEILVMAGKQKLEFYNTLGASLINISLNIILIPPLGMLGAAIATGISLITLNLVRLYQVVRYLKVYPIDSQFYKIISVGIIVIGLGLLAKDVFVVEGYFKIMMLIVIIISFFTLFTIKFILSSDEKRMVFNLIKSGV